MPGCRPLINFETSRWWRDIEIIKHVVLRDCNSRTEPTVFRFKRFVNKLANGESNPVSKHLYLLYRASSTAQHAPMQNEWPLLKAQRASQASELGIDNLLCLQGG